MILAVKMRTKCAWEYITKELIVNSSVLTLAAALFLLSVGLIGCSDCDFKTIDSLPNNYWTADLEYRVCGYYSGFAIVIYPTKEGHPGYGHGSKEPFQAAIRSSERYSSSSPPISIKWIGDNKLVVRHVTRISVEDTSTKLKILKANEQFEDISITYDPEPVIWERK